MTQCPIIQELLPLYIDDAVSHESRTLIEEHLSTCTVCSQALRALRAAGPSLATALPEGASPSADARFLSRLKRNVGTVIGAGLLLLPLTAYIGNYIGRGLADREHGHTMETQRSEAKAALEAIRQASPDPMARLKQREISLLYDTSLEHGLLKVDYQLTAHSPGVQAVPFNTPYGDSPRLYDPATGKPVGQFRQGGGSITANAPTVNANALFAPIGTFPGKAQVQLPFLMVYMKPEQPVQWEVRRNGEESAIAIGQRFAVAGVEFEVERMRFVPNRVQVDYRQVTDPTQVGLHLLTFRLSDRMGGVWGGDPLLERLPDPLRPSQIFDFVTSLSKTWSLRVEHAILALPGPNIPVEVK